MLLNVTSFHLLLSDFHGILEVDLVVTSLFSTFFRIQDETQNIAVFYSAVFENPFKYTLHIHKSMGHDGMSAKGVG